MLKHFYLVKKQVVQTPYYPITPGFITSLCKSGDTSLTSESIEKWVKLAFHGEHLFINSTTSLLCLLPQSFTAQ